MNRFRAIGRMLRARWRAIAATFVGMSVAAVTFAALWVAQPLDPSPYIASEGGGVLLDREGRTLYPFLNAAEQWSFPVALDRVSPYLVDATLAAEDQRYWEHEGVDLIAVIRAVTQNTREAGTVSGASTLTMQAVKWREGWRRTLWGKGVQGLQALRLERNTTKDAILGAYLNGAPYGQNLVGCEAAAQRYFGKTARELTLAEAALLAGLPKSPTALNPLAHPEAALARRGYVLRRMRDDGRITERAYAAAMKASIGVTAHAFPTHAPNVAMRFHPTAPMRTTLDLDIQQRAETLVQAQLARMDGAADNAAALVVDTASGDVLAWVGSADFFGDGVGRQVDTGRAERSPGSALKPFTYAFALEANALYPGELLLDNTLDYGLYRPENFDNSFRGLIPARDALRISLNVPAVIAQQRVGVKRLFRDFETLGFTTLHESPEHYGFGLTLGGCEVRLDQLAAAYAALARLGEYEPLRLIPGSSAPRRRVLSRGVCATLYAMLEQPLPGELGGNAITTTTAPTRVCWKTGTSSRFRDAWCVVFNGHYVVAVWVGNNDGSPSPQLVGARAALPLAGHIFRILPRKTGNPWPDAMADGYRASVCALSGLPATTWCPHTRAEVLPNALYLNRPCDVHYPDGESGVRERWPASANGWDLAKIAAPRAPAEAEEGATNSRVTALRVTSPADRAQFVMTGEAQGDRLRLAASEEFGTLHWYCDDRYLGESGGDKALFLNLTPGNHTVSCLSPDGQTDTATITVTSPTNALTFE